MKKSCCALFILTIILFGSCQNKSKKNQNEPSGNPCTAVVMEILTTSPLYLEKTNGLEATIIKNGGTSFGITVINPDDNSTGNYELLLHENYPDRTVEIATFIFNPSEKQLYEYDVIEDRLIPLDFNKKLLAKFDEVCQ